MFAATLKIAGNAGAFAAEAAISLGRRGEVNVAGEWVDVLAETEADGLRAIEAAKIVTGAEVKRAYRAA